MGSNENPAPHHETPTFGNPDLPPEGMVNTTGDPASATMTGPRNPVLESQFPNVITAPGDGRQHSAVLLVLVQHLAPAPAARRLGARGHAVRFRDFRRDRRGEHVPRDGWHS